MKKLVAAVLAALAIGGFAATQASAHATATYNGNTLTAYTPSLLLGNVRGIADYQRTYSNGWTRFQIRLTKNGVQKGSIVTYGAPSAGVNYRGTVTYPCYLGSGSWRTQVRGVSTSGSVTPWVTSGYRGINCG